MPLPLTEEPFWPLVPCKEMNSLREKHRWKTNSKVHFPWLNSNARTDCYSVLAKTWKRFICVKTNQEHTQNQTPANGPLTQHDSFMLTTAQMCAKVWHFNTPWCCRWTGIRWGPERFCVDWTNFLEGWSIKPDLSCSPPLVLSWQLNIKYLQRIFKAMGNLPYYCMW